MRPLHGLLLSSLLLGTPMPSRSPAEPLAALEFLVGSCWKGTFPDGRKTDEHCFEWVFERKFIRDRHVVEGDGIYRGETIFGWDAANGRLGYWYWSSDGLVIIGAVEQRGDRIVFPSRYTGAGGEVELEAEWVRRGADAYQVTQRRRVAAGWETLWAMELRRQR